MSRLQKDSTIPSVASTSQEGQENRTLKVTLLSNEWKSSTDGELSTINRELAIQLAKHPNVDVSVLLPSCSREDRSSAKSHNVKLIEAQRVPGLEPVLWLSSPPRNHTMDCVIGHGVHLGRLITPIKRNPNYCHCKWIQVVHSAPEEDGMYRNISEGQKKQETEIQLCQMADQVVTIGPKLAEAYKRYLRPSKQGENVFDLTPSIFSEFLEKEQATEERQTFYVLVIGSGDSCEDFTVKGYDIAAKAMAELKDESYKLRFVCAPGGKVDKIAENLLHHGVSRNQLLVRSFNDSREVLANLFCEVDLAIMPSRTDGFGITALEALSAGLPILVSCNSGLGEALKKVSLGSQCVVDSEDPKDWAKEIKRVRQKEREVRLSESRSLRKKYMKKYSWEKACKRLVNRMYELKFGENEQVIRNLQEWQQSSNKFKISGSVDPLVDLHKIASERGYRISDNVGSGNCMFYALSEQLEIVKGVKIHHFQLRHSLVQYLREHPKLGDETDLFHFVQSHTTWGGYLTDMEQDGTWGDHLILWAAANCYRIAIHVISSLPNNSEVIINPDSPLDKNEHLVLGHVHEVHYVSLQPLQENSTSLLGRDDSSAPPCDDQPSRGLTGELTYCDNFSGSSQFLTKGKKPSIVSKVSKQQRLSHKVSKGLGKKQNPAHGKRSVPDCSNMPKKQKLSTYPHKSSSERVKKTSKRLRLSDDELTFADSSGSCSRSPFVEFHHLPFTVNPQVYKESRRCDQSSFSYGLPAPVAVNYNQGNLPVPLVNTSHQGSQTFPQTVTRNEDPIHWGSHTQSFNSYGLPATSTVDYRNPPATFVNPNYQESQTFPQGFIRHDQFPSLVNQSQPSPQVPTWTHQDPSYHSNHTQGYCLDIVCSLLKQEYKKRSQLKPLFWDNTIQLPLEDVYTRLKILSRNKRDFWLEDNEVSMFEIFKNGNDTIVLVEGSPGMGKTTFCLKIAHDWAIEVISMEDSFPEFEVVLLLKCRDIHGDIIEAIDEQLLPKCNSEAMKRELIDYIEDFHLQKKVLIILDGLDELPNDMSGSDVERLLQKKIFPFCYVLATSRQERGIIVRKKVDFDMLLQIEGFTREDAFDYIRKHFKSAGPENVPKGERLIAEISEEKEKKKAFLDALWNNPLNLLLLCIVFEDYQGKLPSYRTELYQIIISCILRRYCAKHDLEAPVDDKNLVRLFEDSLLVLGELAWRCLEKDRFSFHEEELVEFESANANVAARELGLVFKEAGVRKINPQHEYFFFHKTFQEYLAAFYLANKLLKREVYFSELLNFFNNLTKRYRQVFIFMSGILGEDARLLFEQIGKKLKEGNWDWHRCAEEEATFFVECFKESRNDEQVAIALSSFIPFPQTMTFDLSHENTRTDVFHVLKACGSFSQLQLPVHLALEYSGPYIFEHDEAVADIIASNTQLQTLSFSGSVSEGITDLLCKALKDSTLHSFTLETTGWISSCEVVAISDSLAANKTLTTVTLKLPYEVLKSCIAILDKGLSADTPLTSVVLKIFGSWRETEAEDFKKILLNRSLTSLSLTLFKDMQDSLITSVSEGLVANPSLKSLALTFYGKLSNTGVALLKNGFLGNRSLESLELKVFGELPTNWANISRTLHSAVKSTTSFTLHPNVTGMVGASQVACLCPVLNENLLASKLHSLAVNILGELDCSEANDLCKRLIASSVSCVTLNFKERVTDNVANCLFKHLNKLKTLSKLTISIQGELMGDGKNTLERLSRNQTYLFALNVSDSYSGDKICREVGLSADDSSSLTPVFTKVKDGCVTKLSVSVNNPDSISGDWGSTLCEGLAKIESLTTLSLTLNDIASNENIDALWDAVAKNKSLTALSLTFNNYNCRSEPMTCGLSNSLAKNSSLTTLSLTFDSCWVWEELLINVLMKGLAKSTSLTTLSYTLNIDGNLDICDPISYWLIKGLAKNTSLTMLSLTLNHYSPFYCEMYDWLSDELAKNTSLTTLSLTLNNYGDFGGYMITGLHDWSIKSMSLTTLSLTLNNYSDFKGCMISGLSNWLAKHMSLTSLSLAVNNYSNFKGRMISGLSDGLTKNVSLTMLSLAINNYSSFDGDLTDGLIDGLANIKSLTTLSLTLNDHSDGPNSCFHALKNALVKNTSIVTLNLTLSNYYNLYEDWIRGLADVLARYTSLTSINLELNVFSERNSNSESSLV